MKPQLRTPGLGCGSFDRDKVLYSFSKTACTDQSVIWKRIEEAFLVADIILSNLILLQVWVLRMWVAVTGLVDRQEDCVDMHCITPETEQTEKLTSRPNSQTGLWPAALWRRAWDTSFSPSPLGLLWVTLFSNNPQTKWNKYDQIRLIMASTLNKPFQSEICHGRHGISVTKLHGSHRPHACCKRRAFARNLM